MPTYCTISGSNKLMTKLYATISGTKTYIPVRYAEINGTKYIVHKDKTEISTLYTSSTTWKAPDNVTQILLEIVGGGGSGGSYHQYKYFHATGSGGAGGYFKGYINVTPGANYTLTVGSGGARVRSDGKWGERSCDGKDGTASKFGNIVTCNGGKHGNAYKTHSEYSYTDTGGENGDHDVYVTVVDEDSEKGGAGGTVSIGNSSAVAKTIYNVTGGKGGNGFFFSSTKTYGGKSGWQTYNPGFPYYGKGGDSGRTSRTVEETEDNKFLNGEYSHHTYSETGGFGAIKITYYKYGGKYV